mgnify:FL=1
MGSMLQKQILRKAIESPIFSKDVLPKAPLSIFENNEIYKELSNILKRYYQTNSNVLTEDALLTLVETKLDRMKKPSEEQREYFNAIHELYEVRNSNDDTVIDEKIEGYIKKHMRKELLKKAAMNLDNEEFMEKMEQELKEIMLLDVSGKKQEIINVIDDVELKRRALTTIHQNTISTGFQAIDNLNGGGLAKGELGIVVAASGTGKCIVGDSLIYTEDGIIEIKDIPKYFHVDPVTNESEVRVASYTEQGEYTPRDTSHWYNLGLSKTIRVTTKSGYSVEGTPEHPLLVMNKRGELEYKELQKFEKGDYVALAKGADMWASGNKVGEEEAYLMALLVADGYLVTRNSITLSNSDEGIVAHYKQQIENLWGIRHVYSKQSNTSKTIDHTFSNKELKSKLELQGMKMVTASYKEIPHTVLQSSKNVVKRFVQGMFDTKGSIYKGTLELITASKRLAEQLQVVLLNFGIWASLKHKKVEGCEQNNYYRLSITGLSLRQFHEEIGFRLNSKNQSRLDEAVRKDVNTSKEALDYILSYTEKSDKDTEFLQRIAENMLLQPVERCAHVPAPPAAGDSRRTPARPPG